MSTGYAAIPLLKAAPEPDQIADRLDGGAWRGLELCLMSWHVQDDHALQRAIEVSRQGLAGHNASDRPAGAGSQIQPAVHPPCPHHSGHRP